MSEDKDVKAKTPRWIRVLLVVSLGLNLAVLGAVLGAQVSDRSGERRAGGSGPRTAERFVEGQLIGPYARAFSKEDRAALRRGVMARGDTLREMRQDMRAIGSEIVTALRATPFDGEAVRAALSKQRQVQITLQDEGQDILIEQLTSMTPEARARFADNLEKGLNRRRSDR